MSLGRRRHAGGADVIRRFGTAVTKRGEGMSNQHDIVCAASGIPLLFFLRRDSAARGLFTAFVMLLGGMKREVWDVLQDKV